MMLEIVVEGTVGAGKTSLVEILEKGMGMTGFYEMADPTADEILQKYYTDKRRWCLTMELFFLHKRFLQIKEASKVENAVMDRSMIGDFVFVKMQKDSGFLEEMEYELYNSFYQTMSKITPTPKLTIYIYCCVSTTLKRIRKRGRIYEMEVEKEYWRRLNAYYDEEFLLKPKKNMLIINGDEIDFVESDQDRETVLSAIEKALNQEGVYVLSKQGVKRYTANSKELLELI